MIQIKVTTIECADAYNRAVDYYYPNRKKTSNVLPKEFTRLALILQKEQIEANRYIFFVFGILDRHPVYAPKSSALINPMLIAKYHQMQ